jgi:hypothetical protein
MIDFPIKAQIGASNAPIPFAGNLKRMCIPEFLADIVVGCKKHFIFFPC